MEIIKQPATDLTQLATLGITDFLKMDASRYELFCGQVQEAKGNIRALVHFDYLDEDVIRSIRRNPNSRAADYANGISTVLLELTGVDSEQGPLLIFQDCLQLASLFSRSPRMPSALLRRSGQRFPNPLPPHIYVVPTETDNPMPYIDHLGACFDWENPDDVAIAQQFDFAEDVAWSTIAELLREAGVNHCHALGRRYWEQEYDAESREHREFIARLGRSENNPGRLPSGCVGGLATSLFVRGIDITFSSIISPNQPSSYNQNLSGPKEV